MQRCRTAPKMLKSHAAPVAGSAAQTGASRFRRLPMQCSEFMYLLQGRRIFYRQFTVALPRL